MIKYDVCSDRKANDIVKWCKLNGYKCTISVAESKERDRMIFPFNIDAPEEKYKELDEFVGGQDYK